MSDCNLGFFVIVFAKRVLCCTKTAIESLFPSLSNPKWVYLEIITGSGVVVNSFYLAYLLKREKVDYCCFALVPDLAIYEVCVFLTPCRLDVSALTCF